MLKNEFPNNESIYQFTHFIILNLLRNLHCNLLQILKTKISIGQKTMYKNILPIFGIINEVLYPTA